MRNFVSKLFASRKTLLFYVISLFVLWLGTTISRDYISALNRRIYVEHLIDMIKPFDSLVFIEKIAVYVLGFQRIVVFIIFVAVQLSSIFIEEKADRNAGKSITLEIGLIAIAVLNISIVLLFALGLNVIFNPTKVSTYAVLLFVLVSTTTISYFFLNEENEQSHLSSKGGINSILNRLKNFSFPYFRFVLVLYFLLVSLYAYLVRQFSTDWIVIHPLIKSLFFCISIGGIFYSLFGFARYVKRKDEFIRQIIYEQIFITFLIILGILLSYYSINVMFNYKITTTDILMILGVVMLISGFFAAAKYK